MLRSFGFFDDHTDYGTMFRREPTKDGAPDVDFEQLKKL
jgi:hypothetical protein